MSEASPAFLDHALGVARRAAAAAAEVIHRYYRGAFETRIKSDATPVTQADEESEAAIRAVLVEAFPEHAIYGEEQGRDARESDWLWLVDPIDGTKSFVRGYPIFSTQIALMHRGELILGVSSAPCWTGGAGEVAYAQAGEGAWLNGEPLTVSSVAALEKATLSTGNLASLARSPAWLRLGRLIPVLHRIRGYGDFLHYHYLAAGRIDAVIETDVSILDIAALVVIVRAAGGVFTDLSGAPVGLDTTSVLAANPELHARLVREIGYGEGTILKTPPS
jgi:histidinol-phosphatase